MRTHERIRSIRQQSREQVPREDIWFFSESTPLNQSSTPERKTENRESKKGFNETSNHFVSRTPVKNAVKKECTFVVDWQLSNFF